MKTKLMFTLSMVLGGGLIAQTCAFEARGFYEQVTSNPGKAVFAAVIGGLIALIFVLFFLSTDDWGNLKKDE